MRIAFVGTGYVSDYYMTTLANHPALTLAGVWDHNPARLKQFCDFYSATAYDGLDAVLADATVETVAVLTGPEAHFEVAMAVLAAGKNVYCEKPLAMDIGDAKTLVETAAAKDLVVAGAPANALSDAFSLARETLASGVIGAPRLVYAEMEDGPVFREKWREWRSVSGAHWPGAHEFEIGCTLEHAGYGLSWLIGLFGPIRRITGLSGVMFADKGPEVPDGMMAPDFSTACLEFDNGVIARLTSGLCAPRDRSLTVMGETGTLTVADLWDSRSAIHLEKGGEEPNLVFRTVRSLERRIGKALPLRLSSGRKVPYGAKAAPKKLPGYPSQIDFAAGLQAVADCLSGRGKSRERLAAEALHITEAALVLNRLADHGGRYEMTSTLDG